jgi:peptidoglycan hydrolase CwlO-like protein
MNSQIFTAVVSGIIMLVIGSAGTYVGFVNKLRTRVALLEHRLEKVNEEIKRVDKRVDKKSEQFDKIQEDISDIRVKLTRIAAVLDIVENKKIGKGED